MVVYCRKCGFNNAIQDKYCGGCGTSLLENGLPDETRKDASRPAEAVSGKYSDEDLNELLHGPSKANSLSNIEPKKTEAVSQDFLDSIFDSGKED